MHAVLGAADALEYPWSCSSVTSTTTRASGSFQQVRSASAPTDPAWVSHFQARTLSAWRPEMTGTFHYAAPFDSL